MKKWSPWAVLPATKKFQVIVKKIKLSMEENKEEEEEEESDKVMAIKIKWQGDQQHWFGFHRALIKHRTSEIRVKSASGGRATAIVEWDDEFDNLCSFTTPNSSSNQDHKFAPWNVSFNLLYGEKKESKLGRMAVAGKVAVNIAEMAWRMESEVETKLPINLHIAGVAREATLLVSMNFVEIRDDSQDSVEIIHDSAESRKLKDIKNTKLEGNAGPTGSHDSVFSETDGDAKVSSFTESGASPISETEPDPVKRTGWLFSWKRGRASFKPARSKAEPSIKKTKSINDCCDPPDISSFLTTESVIHASVQNVDAFESCPSQHKDESRATSGAWEAKELVSRDGQTKLKAEVFFASFDQCSDKAAGESACTALVAVISHWLQSNQEAMPTRIQFDDLIMQGSFEWRKLCQNEAYLNDFPNKHFDLETVQHAHIRPIAICPERTFIGFFGPEKFESLKGIMSFDDMWERICSATVDYEPKIYIVSWNDHFFVLKVEASAYYIIDTLGERLFERCNQAYILKFDDSSIMHATYGNGKDMNEEMTGADEEKQDGSNEEIICRGKECCREFIKRFLAAIPLKELEEQEKKETVSYISLHHRLQIELNFTCLRSSTSSSLTSSPLSASSALSTSSE